MILCDYGCGQEAKYFFKNGKKCCSENHGSCPNRKIGKYKREECEGFKQINCQYCNKIISNQAKKRHESSCLFNPINIKFCLNCNKQLTSRYSNKFCSTKCSALYTTPGRKHSDETKLKIKESYRKSSKVLSSLNVMRNITFKCAFCNKEWTILIPPTHSKYVRKTCSTECMGKIISIKAIENECGGYREKSSRANSGYYKDIYCASSYELIFVAYHKDINSNLLRCDLKIPYIYKNKKHNYHPDFFIDDKIYEIKGFYTDVVKIKTEATINLGYDIDVLYLEHLKPMLEYLKKKYKFKNILELYD